MKVTTYIAVHYHVKMLKSTSSAVRLDGWTRPAVLSLRVRKFRTGQGEDAKRPERDMVSGRTKFTAATLVLFPRQGWFGRPLHYRSKWRWTVRGRGTHPFFYWYGMIALPTSFSSKLFDQWPGPPLLLLYPTPPPSSSPPPHHDQIFPLPPLAPHRAPFPQ
jgi:hypothetical protein